MEVQLRYMGGGRFQSMTGQTVFGEIKIGDVLRCKITRARSNPQNRFFHSLVRHAYDNQTGDGPLLPSWEHLKYWLLIQAGHCTVQVFDPRAMTPEVAKWLRELDPAMDFTHDRNSIYAKRAKSIAFRAADQDQMNPIVDRVTEIICNDIVPGVDPDELFKMAKDGVA